jgi:4-hydroxybenzoate polyprenyltransferase
MHLASQAMRASADDGELALQLFRSNRFTGLLLLLGFAAVGLSSAP